MEKNENISEPLDELDEDITEDAEEGTDDLDEADAASEYNDSAAQFADLEDALAEEKDKYLRLFAEYDNYRKRTAKEKTETYQNASVQCVEKLLPVLVLHSCLFLTYSTQWDLSQDASLVHSSSSLCHLLLFLQ